jgi:hypothetical protein
VDHKEEKQSSPAPRRESPQKYVVDETSSEEDLDRQLANSILKKMSDSDDDSDDSRGGRPKKRVSFAEKIEFNTDSNKLSSGGRPRNVDTRPPVQKHKKDILRDKEEQGTKDSRMRSPFRMGDGIAKSNGEDEANYPKRVNFFSY